MQLQYRVYRNYDLAVQFKKAAKLFQAGEYPPFPEGQSTVS